MSYLVMFWTMCASMSLLLGLMHLLFWFESNKKSAYLLSATMGFGAAASGILELRMLMAQSPELYMVLLRWENLAIFFIIVPMTWFVNSYFLTGRPWLASLITILWSMGIAVNFLLPGSLTFSQIFELRYLVSFWGEPFTLPVGEINSWKILADTASILFLVYAVDASITLWRREQRNRAWIVGGSIVIFILLAGIHTPLVDAGLVRTPYLVSFSFLAIVFALSYQVVMDAVRGVRYERQLGETRLKLDQLSRSNMLGEHVTTITHELNQPLTAILSNAQAARKYMASDAHGIDAIPDILDDVVRDTKRASEIINWLSTMLKKQDMARKRFDLKVAIKEVISILDGDLKRNNIKITVQHDKAIPPLYAGRTEIQQMILNLLSNAIKSINGSADMRRKIYVRTCVVEGDVQVEITDSGTGIPDDLLDSLFDAFVSGNKDGFGMGLALCRRITEAHGGRIWACNAKAGGAVFTFTLPMNLTPTARTSVDR